MWRPPNWEEIKPRVADCEGVGQYTFDKGVEAGADAILNEVAYFLAGIAKSFKGEE